MVAWTTVLAGRGEKGLNPELTFKVAARGFSVRLGLGWENDAKIG